MDVPTGVKLSSIGLMVLWALYFLGAFLGLIGLGGKGTTGYIAVMRRLIRNVNFRQLGVGGHLVHRQHRSLWSSRLWDDEDEEDLASPRLDRQRLRRCCRRSQLYHQLCQPVLVCVSAYISIASCTKYK